MPTRYVIDLPEEDDHILLTGFETVIDDEGGDIVSRRYIDPADQPESPDVACRMFTAALEKIGGLLHEAVNDDRVDMAKLRAAYDIACLPEKAGSFTDKGQRA